MALTNCNNMPRQNDLSMVSANTYLADNNEVVLQKIGSSKPWRNTQMGPTPKTSETKSVSKGWRKKLKSVVPGKNTKKSSLLKTTAKAALQQNSFLDVDEDATVEMTDTCSMRSSTLTDDDLAFLISGTPTNEPQSYSAGQISQKVKHVSFSDKFQVFHLDSKVDEVFTCSPMNQQVLVADTDRWAEHNSSDLKQSLDSRKLNLNHNVCTIKHKSSCKAMEGTISEFQNDETEKDFAPTRPTRQASN